MNNEQRTRNNEQRIRNNEVRTKNAFVGTATARQTIILINDFAVNDFDAAFMRSFLSTCQPTILIPNLPAGRQVPNT